MEFYKINDTSFSQLQNIAKYLSEIEVKGKNVSYLYHAGITLDAVLQQIVEDNTSTEEEEIDAVGEKDV